MDIGHAERATLDAGARVGRYVIAALIGRGGMGEVYRAHDGLLDRDVALKVIAPEAIGAPDAAARLIREARAASALNHPSIVTIYDVGETDDGLPYIAMEWLEGKTFRDFLGCHSDTQSILEVLLQVASAVGAAHAAGIVHRDLKPENIFVTARGAKVLDFGLAKRTTPLDVPIEQARTAPQENRLTRDGVVMGTPAYMAPEQVRGESDVDWRADVYSFGCMVFEAFSGSVPFADRSFVDVAVAIMRDDPPPLVGRDRRKLPDLDAVVRRCMAKAREDRYQSLAAVADALRAIEAHPAGPRAAAPPRRTIKLSQLAAALAALLVLIFGVYRARGPRQSTSDSYRLVRRLPGTSDVSAVALSPDGKYVAWGRNDNAVVVRQLASGREIDVVRATAPVNQLSFSGDGEFVHYATAGDLYRVSVLGGAPQIVKRNVGGIAAVSSDGGRVLMLRNPALWVSGEPADSLLASSVDPSAIRTAVWSADGKLVVFARRHASTRVFFTLEKVPFPPSTPALLPGEWRDVAQIATVGDSIVVAADDASDSGPSQLWRIRPDGQRECLTSDLFRYDGFGISASGDRIAAIRTDERWDLESVDAASGTERTIQSGSAPMVLPHRLRDGRLVFAANLEGSDDIYVSDADGRNVQRLTTDPSTDRMPEGSPDGSQIAFISERTGRSALWIMNADGSGQRPLVDTKYYLGRPSFSADGRFVYYSSAQPRQVWRIPVGGGTPSLINTACMTPDVSRDGTRLACKAGDDWSLMILGIDGSLQRHFNQRVANYPRWSPGGEAVMFTDGNRIIIQTITAAAPRTITLAGADVVSCDYADDRTLLCAVRRRATSVVLLER